LLNPRGEVAVLYRRSVTFDECGKSKNGNEGIRVPFKDVHELYSTNDIINPSQAEEIASVTRNFTITLAISDTSVSC